MVVAIVALLLISTICFSLVRWALAATQQAERQQWRVQSVWLAESALSNATTRLRDDPDYAGQAWNSGEITGRMPSSRVRLQIKTDPNDKRRRIIDAIADVPDDPTDRVRTQRTLNLTLPESESETTD